MPVTGVRTKWISGGLIFRDASANQLAAIKTTGFEIGASGVKPLITAFTFAAASAASNIAEVTVTATDASGATVAAPVLYHLWLSDAATGAGLTGTAASGTVTVKSASGAVIGTLTSKKALVVQALATGVFTLEITDTAKTGFYVCAQTPTGAVSIATVLATGDYG